MSQLVEHPSGEYRFLPGIPAFSEGIVAVRGYRVVHTRLAHPVPARTGYGVIEKTLAEAGRPLNALCGVELRIPAQMEVPEFRALNVDYVSVLRNRWDLFVKGVNPVPRCNLALTVDPVPTPSLAGFSYIEPGPAGRAQFVTAGINDAALVYGPNVFAKVAQGIVPDRAADGPAEGDRSPVTVARRLAFILAAADERLAALGVAWPDATQVELYLAHDLGDLLRSHVLPAIGAAARRGVRWHCGLAPFIGPEAEMDVRGYVREIELEP